jgi:hypothetical protein
MLTSRQPRTQRLTSVLHTWPRLGGGTLCAWEPTERFATPQAQRQRRPVVLHAVSENLLHLSAHFLCTLLLEGVLSMDFMRCIVSLHDRVTGIFIDIQ